MKKLLSILLILLCITICRSQSQDLANIANGKILNFKTLYEKDNKLFGYFALYTTGKTKEGKRNFEYVILDKNLNKVANKEFEAESFVETYNAYMNKYGKIKMVPSIDIEDKSYKSKNFVYPSSKIIDVKTNIIKKKENFCYLNDTLIDCPDNQSYESIKKGSRTERKEKGYVYYSRVYEIEEGGFLAFDYQDYKSIIKNNHIIRFDENKSKVWKYSYNQNADKAKFEYMRLIDIDDKHVYGILGKIDGNSCSFTLLVFDLNTGNIVVNNPLSLPYLNLNTLQAITDLYSPFKESIDNSKAFYNDKIILVGKHNPDQYYYNGYARLMIDKKTFEVKMDVIYFYSDMKEFIPEIDSQVGEVENNFLLEPRDLFFMKDGSVGILVEKFKAKKFITSDMIYLYTDKDFKLIGAKKLAKDESKEKVNDYLFSQYLNDEKDVVFFYKDERKNESTKNKETFLFINTLIEGKFNQEQIIISSKKNTITPYIAKEGYILLQEHNDNEKEKYNQIRLEKLNY